MRKVEGGPEPINEYSCGSKVKRSKRNRERGNSEERQTLSNRTIATPPPPWKRSVFPKTNLQSPFSVSVGNQIGENRVGGLKEEEEINQSF
jgi:hypothetical protein